MNAWTLWLGPLVLIGAWALGTLALAIAFGIVADAWRYVHSATRNKCNNKP